MLPKSVRRFWENDMHQKQELKVGRANPAESRFARHALVSVLPLGGPLGAFELLEQGG